MANISSERVASTMQKELANIINEHVKDDRVGYINLTEVRLTKDKSFATIFYSILSDDKKIIEKAASEIAKATPLIKKDLAKKMSSLRRQPDLLFKYDEALAYGNHIDKLLKTINKWS